MNKTPKKKRNVWTTILSIVLIVTGAILLIDDISHIRRSSEKSNAKSEVRATQAQEQLIMPGEVFEKGDYILFENLRISYRGDGFEITNGRNDPIRIMMSVVGVKSDGSYEVLQTPSFGGVDEEAYQRDLKENGWALKSYTNLVRPGETLVAEFEIYDFSAHGDQYPAPDIDHDGYYDIIFCVHPQENEDYITITLDDPISEIYKLKV